MFAVGARTSPILRHRPALGSVGSQQTTPLHFPRTSERALNPTVPKRKGVTEVMPTVHPDAAVRLPSPSSFETWVAKITGRTLSDGGV